MVGVNVCGGVVQPRPPGGVVRSRAWDAGWDAAYTGSGHGDRGVLLPCAAGSYRGATHAGRVWMGSARQGGHGLSAISDVSDVSDPNNLDLWF